MGNQLVTHMIFTITLRIKYRLYLYKLQKTVNVSCYSKYLY